MCLLKYKLIHFELLSSRSSIMQFDKVLADYSQSVDALYDRCALAYKNNTETLNEKFKALCGKLSALSPIAIFERGYCSAQKDGKMISSISQIEEGDNISLRLTDGELDCSVDQRRSLI